MAMADLVMPRMPDQQHAWFHHPHHHQPTQRSGHHRSFSYHMPQPQPQQQQQQQQQQTQQLSQPQRQSPPGFNQPADNISPLSTSNSTSPVSPKNYHGRQVRPLYMPAVLRPNEYHSSGGIQAKVPRSPGADDLDDDERGVRSSGSFTSLQGILSLSGLSRRSTGDSGKVVDWNWDLSNYPKVNGQPTRRHWKSDAESEVCDDPTCKKYFNYFVRRHHCRRCGNIFCDPHSSHEVPLDESANYNPRGQLSRACGHCHDDFKIWRGRNCSGTSSLGGDGEQTPQQQGAQQQQPGSPAHGSRTVPTSPIVASPISGASPTTPGKSQPEVALSVPSDWNWSTF